MIDTSAEYKVSIAKRTKRQTYGKIEINYTDPFVDQSIIVAVSSEGPASYKGQVADGIYEPTHNWFPLDGSAILDGTFVLMPPSTDAISALSMQVGWWSGEAAGVGGVFADPQTLTVTFVARTIESLLVASDTIKNEYPVDFTIKLYDAEDGLLHTETVTGNTLEYWTATIDAVPLTVKQVLSITKWSHADRCAKVYEFFTALKRTYLSDEIFDFELLEERESDTASIPVGNISSNQFQFKLHNLARQFDYGSGSAIANLIKPMRKVIPYIGAAGVDGETEWIPLGQFWTQEWDVPDSDIYASSVAFDLLTLMAKTSYTPGFQTDKTLYDIIEAICQDFGLLEGTYYIDPELDVDIIPYANIEKTNHREAIRIAAEAGSASVFVNRLGVLHIEGPNYLRTNSAESVRTIDSCEYFTRKNPSRYSTVYNVIRVNTSPLVPDAETSLVYEDDELVIPAGQTLVIQTLYSDSPCIEALASLIAPPGGVTITDTTYYSWGADVTITNANAVDETVELNVNAKVLRVTGARTAEVRDETSIIEFGEQVFTFPENPLIQDYQVALKIANQVLSSYSNARRDLSQEWRGDPALELSDRITTDASRTDTDFYWLIRQTLTWDGTLKATHDGAIVPPEYILMTEDGYLMETEDDYLIETE